VTTRDLENCKNVGRPAKRQRASAQLQDAKRQRDSAQLQDAKRQRDSAQLQE